MNQQTPYYGGFAKVSKMRVLEDDGLPVRWCDGPLVVFNRAGLAHVAVRRCRLNTSG